MNTIARLINVAFLAIATMAAGAAGPDYTKIVAELIDPAKLAILGERGANPRVQKYVYWLATAQAENVKPAAVAQAAVEAAGYTNKVARKLTVKAMLRNLDIATKLGCLNKEGLEKMRHGRAPTIGKGRYQGDQLSVDHIIPRAVMPGLDNVIANLELMPLRMNEAKNAKLGPRQRALAYDLRRAGLLSR